VNPTLKGWAIVTSSLRDEKRDDRRLTSGAKIWVRVRAVGVKNDTGPFSDPATKTVPQKANAETPEGSPFGVLCFSVLLAGSETPLGVTYL